MTSQPLQFEPFSGAIEPTFWHALTRAKLDTYKLDDSPKDIVGSFSGTTADMTGKAGVMPARMVVSGGSFEGSVPTGAYPCVGVLRNTNTIEDFKNLDKTQFFQDVSKQIWDDITSARALTDPSLLNRFLMLTYADLKKYSYHYWFGFPALILPKPAQVTRVSPIDECFKAQEIVEIGKGYDRLQTSGPVSAFWVIRSAEGVRVAPLTEGDALLRNPPTSDEMTLAFADPSRLASHPGWPLRNLLMLVKQRWKLNRVNVLSYRPTLGTGNNLASSIVFDISLPGDAPTECPKSAGWEKNAAGKLGSRVADLAPLMDPKRLAETSVDLNLKLMRWRILPELNLDKISSTKCLLLGSGTLGCYVARSLMAWGVRQITFVDNGRVSFSNPVRQPLFTFEDCLDGGKPKAQAAAENLSKVFGGVKTHGHQLNIPMPGHVITDEKAFRHDITKLIDLINEHDAVFLLMDSRESRWLPTVLGAAAGKIVINAALGFDTFLVMRHGMRRPWNSAPTPHAEAKVSSAVPSDTVKLGCYFCNDAVAPADSMKDRTLDQQCTVTRPGLSAIASASAVELLVSVLNHTKGPDAPADSTLAPSELATSTPLGLLPHQIRGFLTHFNNLLVVGHAYDKCTACSETILSLFEQDGIQFLLRALRDPAYLEEVTGLKQLHEETERGAIEWDIDDEEGEDW